MNSNSGKRKILLTGARYYLALELARHFRQHGYDVYVADTSSLHVSRFSNAVCKSFVIPSPRFSPKAFLQKLLEIVKEKKIDLLIPIWEETLYLSRHLEEFPKSCSIFCSPFEVVHRLHNKWLFTKKLETFHFKAPRSFLVESRQELKKLPFKTPYILKPCYSRASMNIIKISPPDIPSMRITEKDPWIAQEYLEGDRFCSYSVCYEGRVLAHSAYPVQFTLDGNSCIAFEAVDHPKIYEWVKTFVEKVNYTGQIGFDFIETDHHSLYAIDCNPRATSGVHLFHFKDRIDRAFFHETSSTIFPTPGNTQQIMAGMFLYGWKRGLCEKRFLEYMKKLFTTKDVIFNSQDLKPFFLQPVILISYLIKCFKERLTLPNFFIHDLSWNHIPNDIELIPPLLNPVKSCEDTLFEPKDVSQCRDGRF